MKQYLEAAKIEDDNRRHKALQATVDMVMKVLIASFASDAAFSLLVFIVSRGEEIEGTKTEVFYRLPYALLMSWIVPICQYYLEFLRKGETLVRDTVKVVHLSLGMSLAWAWKDLVNSLGSFKIFGASFCVYLAVALGLQFVTASYEGGPCYRHAKSEMKSGKDGVRLRLLTASDQCRLALGFAWNSVVRTPITSLESQPHSELPALVQLLYFAIAHVAISSVRFRYRLLEARWAAEPADAGCMRSLWKANVTTFM